jgi:hypothetical protein
MLKLHSKFPLLRPCLGIHPSKVSSVLRVAKISESQLTDEALVMSKAKELVEVRFFGAVCFGASLYAQYRL